jgi:hypothetical protein
MQPDYDEAIFGAAQSFFQAMMSQAGEAQSRAALEAFNFAARARAAARGATPPEGFVYREDLDAVAEVIFALVRDACQPRSSEFRAYVEEIIAAANAAISRLPGRAVH